MSSTCYGPEVLRTEAWQLRTYAASVSSTLSNVDQEISNLNGITTEALPTENLRRSYEAQRQQLLHIPDLLTGFALALEQAAEIFEQIDQPVALPGSEPYLPPVATNREISQDIDLPRTQPRSLVATLPHWSEWGQDDWQVAITPIPESIHKFIALPTRFFTYQPPSLVAAEHPSLALDEILQSGSSWSLTGIELFYLGGLLHLPGFLGVSDPFQGCADDEINAHLTLARQSLLQRSYLIQTAEGEQPAPSLGRLLHSTASAVQVIIAVQNTTNAVIYLAPEGIVMQQPLADQRIGFTMLDTLSEVQTSLHTLLSSFQGPPAPGIDITIAQPVLEYTCGILAADPSPKKIAACAAALTQTGLQPESAAAFALALARPVSTGYITIFHRDASTAKRQSGFAWLTGASGVWIAGLPHAVFPTALTWQPASSHTEELALDTIFAYHS